MAGRAVRTLGRVDPTSTHRRNRSPRVVRCPRHPNPTILAKKRGFTSISARRSSVGVIPLNLDATLGARRQARRGSRGPTFLSRGTRRSRCYGPTSRPTSARGDDDGEKWLDQHGSPCRSCSPDPRSHQNTPRLVEENGESDSRSKIDRIDPSRSRNGWDIPRIDSEFVNSCTNTITIRIRYGSRKRSAVSCTNLP
jgi:hypothetical protein